MSLSKMHVRFIQSQNSFFYNGNKAPITQIYIKDNTHLYFLNTNKTLTEQSLTLNFNEATPALTALKLTLDIERLSPESDEYEDALLFFNVSSKPTELLLLSLVDQQQTP